MTPAAPTFDARPLIEPVDREAVRTYNRLLRERSAASGFSPQVVQIIVIVIVAVFFVGVIGSVGGSIFAAVVSTGAFGPAPFVIFVLMVAAIGTAIFFVLRGLFRSSDRAYRLDRFAAANGMSYVPTLSSPALPGMIFDLGSARVASDLVRGDKPRFVEFANYRYTTGSGKNRTTHAWGYVAVRLDTPLPHIVLDATSNNGLFGGSNLPASFDKEQRLGLEGDFDQHFALYCPEGYEPDALYLFTPDIMARFIDNAAALDVEIVDDWMFLYAKRDFSTLDPATWAWLFSVVQALLDKLAQWARWRDDRLTTDASASGLRAPLVSPAGAAPGAVDGIAAAFVGQGAGASGAMGPPPMLRPPPGVAPQGRRLSRRVPWWSIVFAVAIVLFWLVGQFDLFELLLGR